MNPQVLAVSTAASFTSAYVIYRPVRLQQQGRSIGFVDTTAMVQMEGNDIPEDTAMDISPSRPVNIMTQAWVSELSQASANLRMLGLTVCVQSPVC